MKITLENRSAKECAGAMSVIEIAADISEGLARMAYAGEIGGQVVDLHTVVDRDCELNILTANDKAGLTAYHHTTSYVLAEAVRHLYPEARLTIGPSIDTGFYYDLDAPSFSKEDLDKIEAEIKKIIKGGTKIKRFTPPREEAVQFMEEKGEPYKMELIQDLPEDAEMSFYRQGDFVDLCAGPHLMNTKPIKAFKLISSSGTYWGGSEKNAMLFRIYGATFMKKDELNEYLEYLESIRKRGHNRLGRELELFATMNVIGQRLPLLMPRGAKIIQTMQRWIGDEEKKRGYIRTETPLIVKEDLCMISDHWEHCKEGMFVLGDEEKDDKVFALRPMTCSFQYYVYKQSQKSYRDLLYRYGETSTLFRNEDSGEMHGPTHVRQSMISEGHLVVRPDQLEGELKDCIDLAKYCLTTLNLGSDVAYRMSRWDPNDAGHYLGMAGMWDRVQDMMWKMPNHIGIQYTEEEDEAAFYGPKLDIQAKNICGKEGTMITIQLDMFLMGRFDVSYVDKDGTRRRPYTVHRTSMGCYEGMLAWIIEKYEGAFPTQLYPEQIQVLPISEKYHEYAEEVEKEFKNNDTLTTVDEHSEKIDYKIREAKLQKISYILVVGRRGEEDGVMSVRGRFNGDEGQKSLEQFIDDIYKEIRTKEIKKIIVTDQWKCGWKPHNKAGNGVIVQSIRNEMEEGRRRSENGNAVATAHLFAEQSDRQYLAITSSSQHL